MDYVNESNGYVLFRTVPEEKKHLVFQMGTANANRAVKLAQFVQDDVAAIGEMRNFELNKSIFSPLIPLNFCYLNLI